jgi:hypothetical protein
MAAVAAIAAEIDVAADGDRRRLTGATGCCSAAGCCSRSLQPMWKY